MQNKSLKSSLSNTFDSKTGESFTGLGDGGCMSSLLCVHGMTLHGKNPAQRFVSFAYFWALS